jgi:hypothetical protein
MLSFIKITSLNFSHNFLDEENIYLVGKNKNKHSVGTKKKGG